MEPDILAREAAEAIEGSQEELCLAFLQELKREREKRQEDKKKNSSLFAP